MEEVKFIDDENSGEAKCNNQVLDFYNNKYKQDGYSINNIHCEIGRHGSINFIFNFNTKTCDFVNIFYNNGYFGVLGGLRDVISD